MNFQNVLLSISLALIMACQPTTSQKETPKNEEPKVEQSNVKKQVLLFFGNSITAGYQLDISEAFPALIEERLDSLGFSYTVINAGLSGETTAGGLNRIDWVLTTVPDIFVLELGANDALRGLDLKETKTNLQAILDKVKAVNPNVQFVIAGMQVPPNLGLEYTAEFRSIFKAVAEKNDAALIPFILEGVAGDPTLNLPDGIHPTPAGHKILAETVWKIIQPLLKTNP